MKQRTLFTSESVTEGHPDKVCDRISDAVLDAILADDPQARVACETACTTGMVLVMGEISTSTYVDIPKLVRSTLRDIGYSGGRFGFDCDSCAVLTSIDEQSGDIAMGVDRALEEKNGEIQDGKSTGAGDQGLMFGFACDETPELMPMPIALAHRMARRLTEVRREGILPYLGPDGKTQVTIEYEDDRPVRVDTVVVSSQHTVDADIEKLRRDILNFVIRPIVPENMMDENTKVFINPTGRFVVGGPEGDAGLTGRKIIVDTYGGYARHGGGAFSGKDPTKVDRSACYAARHIAKNVVAAGLARKCEVQLAYAIGVAKPVSIRVDTYGTSTLTDEAISKLVADHFDLRPAAIIETFDLRRPIYSPLSAYGHFGREELDVPWERTDRADELRLAAQKL
ncbi:methionine adenosyltransferase [Feifania hominis]|uniref:S-adenosylmethionine synthase n=1 Tax=Feifania hominis TaxID=2763660 RepID=A0A926DCT6_9FIRM|nr:methionine adenosyltransferase [Feifania hominis]MBC8535466.1 methionine adenosyltransferase [Feifania hominis]